MRSAVGTGAVHGDFNACGDDAIDDLRAHQVSADERRTGTVDGASNHPRPKRGADLDEPVAGHSAAVEELVDGPLVRRPFRERLVLRADCQARGAANAEDDERRTVTEAR